ncbi:hypothetical protein BKA70DRAFT_1331052 [Coprinopsis sp. MPI-PUGE-AT-0042]|nr:hypothetical protein BKA70DRAFT_1331052 [Coprinopsis sp. MPI-PUGE-AT-0042]
MNSDLSSLYVQVEDQPDITLDLFKRLASLDLEPSIFTREGKLPASRFPGTHQSYHHPRLAISTPLSAIRCCMVWVLIPSPKLHSQCYGGRPRGRSRGNASRDAPYHLVFPGNLRRSEETPEDVHRTSGGQRKPGDSATRIHLVGSRELEG